MKHRHILSLFLLLFLVLSCSSKMATQDTKTDNVTTENIGTTASEEVTNSKESEITTVAVSSTENEINKAIQDKEIELINTQISKNNENLAFYTKKESTVDWETLTCQTIQYKNENGVVMKLEAICGKHSWEIYMLDLSKNTSKLIYGKYLEKVSNAVRPIVREFYSIGSMIPSDNAYRLILDESGKEVAPAEYRKYSVLYEAAFDAFSYE